MEWSWFFGSYHDEIVAPGKQPVLLLLTGLILSFGFIRTSTRLIRAQVKWWPGNVSAGGIHLHHELFGVLIMLGAGIGEFSVQTAHPWRDVFAFLFGIGAGLVLDEFALLLRLKDVYWTEQGRSSIDAVIVTVLVMAMLLVHAVPFGVNTRHGGELSARWFVFSAIAVNVGFTIVTALKGKPWIAFVSTCVTLVGILGAVRLATPTSPWARKFYDAGKCERAALRAAPWMRVKSRLVTLIGGAPDPETVPAPGPVKPWATVSASEDEGALTEQP